MTISPQGSLRLQVITPDHPDRTMIENYVAQRYQRAFDAQLETFMPVYLALYEQDKLISVCGIRSAASESLFLESYLIRPAEIMIGERLGINVSRGELIEFGQLASFSKGFSRAHFFMMSQHLIAMGYRCCIFTATGPLLALMQRMHLQPQIIGAANPQVIERAWQWGNYYQHHPQVMAGMLSQGVENLPLPSELALPRRAKL